MNADIRHSVFAFACPSVVVRNACPGVKCCFTAGSAAREDDHVSDIKTGCSIGRRASFVRVSITATLTFTLPIETFPVRGISVDHLADFGPRVVSQLNFHELISQFHQSRG